MRKILKVGAIIVGVVATLFTGLVVAVSMMPDDYMDDM